MTVTKLRGTLQDYFERMTGQVIEGAGVFDDELVIFLDNGDEVCLWSDEGNLAIRIDERADLDS